MKRNFSYLLTVLILLNVCGYYGFFVGLQLKSLNDFSTTIDATDFNPEHTITLKIPLAIPYMGDTQFERVKGDFEYQGNFYSLIKQRYAQDTLYIICVENHATKRITSALADYVKTFIGGPTEKGNHSKPVFSFVKDFLPFKITISNSHEGWTAQQHFSSTDDDSLSLINLGVLSPPPRF